LILGFVVSRSRGAGRQALSRGSHFSRANGSCMDLDIGAQSLSLSRAVRVQHARFQAARLGASIMYLRMLEGRASRGASNFTNLQLLCHRHTPCRMSASCDLGDHALLLRCQTGARVEVVRGHAVDSLERRGLLVGWRRTAAW